LPVALAMQRMIRELYIGPLIVIRATEIRLAGELAGTTRFVEELGRMQKIDDLFDKLKHERES
jgi:hypothetical protein